VELLDLLVRDPEAEAATEVGLEGGLLLGIEILPTLKILKRHCIRIHEEKDEAKPTHEALGTLITGLLNGAHEVRELVDGDPLALHVVVALGGLGKDQPLLDLSRIEVPVLQLFQLRNIMRNQKTAEKEPRGKEPASSCWHQREPQAYWCSHCQQRWKAQTQAQ